MPASRSRRYRALFVASVLTAIGALFGCGGGGGGGGPAGPAPLEVTVELGVIASTVPTVVPVTVANPFAGTATASLGATSGPAAPAAGELPAALPGGGSAVVSMVVNPAGTPGLFAATVEVVVVADGGGGSRTVTYRLSGAAEAIAVEILPQAVDFGEVPVGTSATRTVTVRNASAVSPTTVTSISIVGAATDGAFLTDALAPVPLPAGASLSIDVVCAPTVVGTPSGSLRVTAHGMVPRLVPLAATAGGLETLDFGTQTFDGSGFTPVVDVPVPADAISCFVEAQFAAGSVVGLGRLETPQGVAYENEAATGAYAQWPDQEIFGAQVPSTDQPSLALVAGTWRVRLRRFSGAVATASLKVYVQRRPGATGHVGRLDLNVFFAPALTPDAASAPTDADVQDILSRVNDLYAQQGISLGDVAFHDLGDTAYDDVTQAEFPALLRLSSMAASHRLNYFFVRTAIGGGVLGIAAKIGGGTVNGTSYSGVMGLWIESPTASQRDLVARVMAHEMGHFLGLYHTTESNGAWDAITDTAQCPASGCSDASLRYLMHWNASTGGAVVTNGQGLVLRGHPLVAAAPPPAILTLRTIRWAGDDAPLDVSPWWCGTCATPPDPDR